MPSRGIGSSHDDASSHRVRCLCLTAMCGFTARAQSTRWVVAGDVSSDLWFHTLAIIGGSAPGALPFYDSAYVRTVVDTKRTRALGPTLLDRQAQRLRSALQSDDAFEVLHFLPLYLGRTKPEALAQILRSAIEPSAPGSEHQELIGALHAQLGSETQRALLFELADVVTDEWRSYFAASVAVRASTDSARWRELQSRCDASFAPRLAGVFRALKITRGVLLVSPALGPEGRIVDLGSAGTIVAVSAWSQSDVRDAPLLAAVHELCFPLLAAERRTQPNAALARSPDENSRAAVQCGALLAESISPTTGYEYRSLFLRPRASDRAAVYRRRFDERVYVEQATMRAISTAVARAAPSAGAWP